MTLPSPRGIPGQLPPCQTPQHLRCIFQRCVSKLHINGYTGLLLIPKKLANISSVKLHCQSFKIFTVSLLIGCLGVSPFYGHCLEAILDTFDKIYMFLFHVEYHVISFIKLFPSPSTLSELLHCWSPLKSCVSRLNYFLIQLFACC